MEFVLFDDFLLLKIFEKLNTVELVSSGALVCKKWKDVVFNGGHRGFPVGLYSLVSKSKVEGDYRTYPLCVFRSLCELNLLKQIDVNCHGETLSAANLIDIVEWRFQGRDDIRFENQNFFLAAPEDYDERVQNPCILAFSDVAGTRFGTLSTPGSGSYEATLVVNLTERFMERGLTENASIDVIQSCPEFELHFVALQEFANSNSEILIEITVSLDDGGFHLDPFEAEEVSFDQIHENALYSKTIQSDKNDKSRALKLDMNLSGYPPESRRLIITIRGHLTQAKLIPFVANMKLAKAQDL